MEAKQAGIRSIIQYLRRPVVVVSLI